MIIIAQGAIELTRTCEIYTTGSVIQIILDEGSLDVSFDTGKNAEAALQVIKQEIKRQSSSSHCEIVIDVDCIKSWVEERGN